MRLRRSELSTPASSRKMLASAARCAADLVFLDLEDSVAPEQKAAARENAAWALTELDWQGKSRALRINGIETPYAHDDIIEVVTTAGPALDLIIIPKVRTADHVRWVDILLDQLELKLELKSRIKLEVLIEDVAALVHIDAIASASTRLEALIFGPGDFAASQGVEASGFGFGHDKPAPADDPWSYVRNRVAIAARAAGLDAVDGPFDRFEDDELYRAEARGARAKGFVGKWAIHPRQIPIANEVFSPAAAHVNQAREVIEAYRQALAQGQGAIVHDGRMVDAASIRPLEAVVTRAEQIAQRTNADDRSATS